MLLATLISVGLAGCATGPTFQAPVVGVKNETHDELLNLPPPDKKIAVAVYAFEDETGQFEFSNTVQTLSRAVTQGATSILIEALLKTGNGTWFTVVEREGLDNLLRERQIIRETRALYEGGGDLSRNYLPPLLFAGMMLEGGIIGYDTNTLTGGVGARLLGIGGNTEFRQDTVTVYLRAISTQSGEVLESVNVSKTIFSVALSADVFRFVSADEILELDAGVTTNEPEHVAVKQVIEKAVVALVVEGARDERWAFADPGAAVALLDPPSERAVAPGPTAAREAQAQAQVGPGARYRPAGARPAVADVPVSAGSTAPSAIAGASRPAPAGLKARRPQGAGQVPVRPSSRARDGAGERALDSMIAEAGDHRWPEPAVAVPMQDWRGMRLQEAGALKSTSSPPPREQNAGQVPPRAAPVPGGVPSVGPSTLTPREVLLARLAAVDEHPEPWHGGAVND